MDFAVAYSRVVRYSAENAAEFLRQLATPEHAATRQGRDGGDRNFRLAASDALRDADRHTEADLLADPAKHVVVHDGQVVPGAIKHRQAYYADGSDADEILDIIHHDGTQAAINHLRNNYDYGSGDLIDDHDGGGSSDWRADDETGSGHRLGWNRGLNYVWLSQEMEVPETAVHVREGGSLLHRR